MNEVRTFPMDAQRYLADTVWCDPKTDCAHFRLILTYYSLGRPPKDDVDELCRICKLELSDFHRVKGVMLARLGWAIINGEWRHSRIEAVISNELKRERDAILKDIQQQQQTFEARLAKLETDSVTRTVTRFVKPELDEVKLRAVKIGLPDDEVEKFISHYESNGWKVGRNPMKNWTAALSHWKLVWQQRNVKLSPAMQAILDRDNLKRIEDRLQVLRGQMPFAAGDKRKEEFSQLKTKRNELVNNLGLNV